MEKLLATSFISAPTDFFGPAWIRARMSSGGTISTSNSTAPAAEDKNQSTGHCPPSRSTTGDAQRHGDGNRARPHFALEFDGLHCFETFVIH